MKTLRKKCLGTKRHVFVHTSHRVVLVVLNSKKREIRTTYAIYIIYNIINIILYIGVLEDGVFLLQVALKLPCVICVRKRVFLSLEVFFLIFSNT